MAIMVCFDFADIFLPLAKALRYLRLGNYLIHPHNGFAVSCVGRNMTKDTFWFERSAGRHRFRRLCHRVGSYATLSDAQYSCLDCGSFTAGDVVRRYTMGGREWGSGRALPTHMGLHSRLLLER